MIKGLISIMPEPFFGNELCLNKHIEHAYFSHCARNCTKFMEMKKIAGHIIQF